MKSAAFFRLVLVATIAVAISYSCTEKIDLVLKNSEPQLVIEGNISDEPGPYYVILTKSRLYNDDNSFTGLSGATVVLSDDAGNSDTLTSNIDGLYQTNFIQGTVGRTYHLQVNAEGKTYDSYCMMPTPVDIDSIVITEETGFDGKTRKVGDILVRDPAGVQNNYRVVSEMQGYKSSGFSVHSDRLWDGKLRSFNVPHSDYQTGDTLTVSLWSITEHVYKYFRDFNQNQNNFGAPAAPANPTSVFTPSTLGYFSAHSVKTKTVIVP
ncbi:MAG: DUF4249 domain-containing protein [Chitinophagales bacterium]|nr:DUF4249 domain-containing protein [Chitinophagales bacterium]